MAAALAKLDSIELNVLAIEDAYSHVEAGLWENVEPETSPAVGPRAIGYAPRLARRLAAVDPEVVHTHGLWLWQSAAVHSWSTSCGRPYVVSPHGMLDPWALNNSRWKKRIALALYEGRHLRDAKCLHALCESEHTSFRSFGLTQPVAIIPNGISLPARMARASSGPRRLVFLGRLHPKKGVRELLAAWAQLSETERDEWRLVIAGWDDGGHEAELRKLAQNAGSDSSVEFAGPVFGVEKEQLLADASAFILPSFSEGLPMAVLEAWSYGLPVVMTDNCNLPEGFASEAAVRVAPDANSIAAGLRGLTHMKRGELAAMGARGRALVERQFSWPQIAAQMAEVYRWVLGGGAPPACVETT